LVLLTVIDTNLQSSTNMDDFLELTNQTQAGPAWPYPEFTQSYWGPATSTMNFCEMDYYLSPYIAEFINTFSNLSYLYLAGFGLWYTPGDLVVRWSYVLSSVVGIGSILFHASMKYEMQLVDELSMLYSTAISLYSLFQVGLKSRTKSVLLAIAVFGSMTGLSVAHHIRHEPTLHQVCFGIMVLTVCIRCMVLNRRVAATRPKVSAEMGQLVKLGTVLWLVGTGLWFADWWTCEDLHKWRASVGMPIGFLSELHGWWHIISGAGGFYYLAAADCLRTALLADPRDYVGIAWKMRVLPHVVKIANAYDDGINNSEKNQGLQE